MTLASDCKNCRELSEIAPTRHKENGAWVHQIECVRCGQKYKRNTLEEAILAWNQENEQLWNDATEEAFNRIIVGCEE